MISCIGLTRVQWGFFFAIERNIELDVYQMSREGPGGSVS